MKSVIKNWSLALALVGLLLTTYSCDNEDDTPEPVEVSFSGSGLSVGEDEGQVELTVSLSGTVASASTFEVSVGGTAVYGTDYTTSPGASGNSITVSVAPGESSKTITIIPIDNDEVVGNKTITFSLASVGEGLLLGNTTQLEVTIVEDDKPIVSIATLGFEEVDLYTINGEPANGYNMRYIDRDILNVTQDPRDDANGDGRLLVSSDSILRKVAVVTYVPESGATELGFSSFYFDTFGEGSGLAGWRRYGVMSEIDQRTTNPDIHPRHSDGFIWGDRNSFGSGWNIVPDHDGVQAFRMGHTNGKARLVIDPVDLSGHENIILTFTLTTVRAEEFGTPLEDNVNKPVILDIFAAANVPASVAQESKTGESVLQGMDRIPLLNRQGAAMVTDGVIYPDNADLAPANSADYFLVEELEFDISERYAVLNSGRDLGNLSLVVDFQTPGREPTTIYIDKIELKGTER